ncbi:MULTISPECIES: imidazole glycerol phosphate synthase subunit HisH [unclassified Bacillus (in: firmicutes)]|uniref:imidazole glycerol phosphate synthase subunit HisH n=1 Tax=unclassified Bacillus (in: firmicutes) TaxID=185979 RepID=UPI0008EA1828|nr:MULTISPECIES: imidazole glycerol phosphate synthase subunit HisH [unclassified Bacillus (in: firmicutes)]SFB22129.1 glutamine amidotransferase [Bacillus sp. UNCCL13]SFQ91096.1 glutamine amidotransferase [Bacillus sp. cl95]
MIGIVDYGMGNLFSVSKALERLDAEYFITKNKDELMNASALLLPGVGSFRDAMKSLNETGLAKVIVEFAQTGKPLLGICLGMQLLFEESEENVPTKGLGLLPGKIERFSGVASDSTTYKVPHMGWNRLEFILESPITAGLDNDYVYFVHSYFLNADQNDTVIAKSSYHESVAAIVGRGNVFGMQFHPEKSSKLGMELLRNFKKLAEERTVTP